ncbi:MAG TPA: dipicolinate synthase subunit B [Candidatus Butyricicoccus avistercoris]|mgnify:FL=1|uniref:Dipicolinate synthase subunit B n=1 Tax=Candidatus Butyricicoccus avistercoris TaxID=2838518 RepID=A0A9D1PFQ9_9FIRM|nr:dipicolinate synthase subunit B [Candidatus Butyricicoccus avistercoris]
MSDKIRIGFAMTGSFCTFSKVIKTLEDMSKKYDITAILSNHSATMDTKFGKADVLYNHLSDITKKPIIDSIVKAEPIGPQGLFDVLVVAPCTGNTLAKLSNSIIDGTVPMAVKSHLRRERPVVIAISTNDGLSGSAENIGRLLNRKNYYFVPFKQDAPNEKPRSLVANMNLIPDTIDYALENKQIQPIIYS